jgi:hypothetical protein
MTHVSDGLRIGDAYYGRAVGSDPAGREDRGVPSMTETSILVPIELGAPAAADPDGICVNQSTTGAASLTITGALASNGVATFDVPRTVSMTSTANESGVTFTITGTDKYGAALVADLAGPNNTTVNTPQAFKTVTAVAVDGNLTSTQVDVGSSSILGLPYHLLNAGKILGITEDGLTATGTIVAGYGVTEVATATTADVRGTYTPESTLNGSVYVSLLMVADGSSKASAYGTDQYGG